ncbi:protein ANTAGONIST OF LIKE HETEROCHROMATIN PROTEIN 1-like [Cimex lectularius]|uniref:DDE Tnp4 domain-containing protein n=1 Tax=Cimex lectularius TaxID=79782 RepID=A0A8I6RNY9_CIMLE|nr:protein ANTAGONIST OF LIKE HETEROCHROMATIN PROTEIN 1-like [Cimex lectularius]
MPNRKVVIAGAAFICTYLLCSEDRKKRRWWKTNLYNRRSSLLVELKSQQISGQYKNFTRMSPSDFDQLLTMIASKISRQDTTMRPAISPQDRLALTLRFLATGDSYTSLQYTFRVSKQSISCIVPEVCKAIIEALKENIKLPKTEQEWIKIANKFDELWNFPHCIGAMDGKHVILEAPIRSGTEYRNYKSNFSIVMFALVDAEYNYTFVDVGCQGRISDGGVFKETELFKKLERNSLRLPAGNALPGRNNLVPYVFVGDSAFPLQNNIMKPYPGDYPKGSPRRIFNYRLSRARRIVENVFGISASVFRVLRKPMLLQPEIAETVVMAIAHLHNFLKNTATSKNLYAPPGSLDSEQNGRLSEGTWRRDSEMSSLLPLNNIPRRAALTAKQIRIEFTDYFLEEGKVSWQSTYC